MADIPLSIDAVGGLLPTVWACQRYAVIHLILRDHLFPEGFRRGAKEFVKAKVYSKGTARPDKWPVVACFEFDPTVHLTTHLSGASRRVAGCGVSLT